MTLDRARVASQTLEDVYTPMGDAVVIAHICVADNQRMAYVSGAHFTGHHPIANLTAREDLDPAFPRL